MPSIFKDIRHFEKGEFRIEKLIDTGAQGSVSKAHHDEYGVVAVKYFLRKNRGHGKEQEKREIEHIAKQRHHHIIQFHGYVVEQSTESPTIIGYAMEYMADGSLSDVIYNRDIVYDLTDVTRWARQASVALAFLHSEWIIHRDIKPQNMLLSDGRRTVKLCDFGCTRDQQEESMTAGIGTRLYMAPELMRPVEKVRYSNKCDVYSMGITLWEMATRRNPFAIEGQCERLPLAQISDAELRDIVRSCLFNDPVLRPTMIEIGNNLKALESSRLRSHQNNQHLEDAILAADENQPDVSCKTFVRDGNRHRIEMGDARRYNRFVTVEETYGKDVEECDHLREKCEGVLYELASKVVALKTTQVILLQREYPYNSSIIAKGNELQRLWDAVVHSASERMESLNCARQIHHFDFEADQMLTLMMGKKNYELSLLQLNLSHAEVAVVKSLMKRRDNFLNELKPVEVRVAKLCGEAERLWTLFPNTKEHFEMRKMDMEECLNDLLEALSTAGKMCLLMEKKTIHRSWNSYYVILCGQLLYFFNNDNNVDQNRATVPPLNIYGAKCDVYPEYVKRRHTFRIALIDGSEFIFSCSDYLQMLTCVDMVNYRAFP